MLLESSLPNLRFLDKSSEHVSTKSPIPDKPWKVIDSPPRATPSRVISAKPLVMSAA